MVLGPSNRNCACKARLDFELGPALRVVSAPVAIQLRERWQVYNCNDKVRTVQKRFQNTRFSYTQSYPSRNHWYYTLPICHSS